MKLEKEHELPWDDVRIITQEEADSFPETEKPLPPGLDDEAEKTKKIKEEKERGHPAFAMRDEYKSRGEKVE